MNAEIAKTWFQSSRLVRFHRNAAKDKRRLRQLQFDTLTETLENEEQEEERKHIVSLSFDQLKGTVQPCTYTYLQYDICTVSPGS